MSPENNLRYRFKNMKNRCYNPNDKDYKWYDAKGITIADEWLADHKVFVAWALANGFREGLQLDRIDSSKGYTPDNCRWVTSRVNTRNRSCNKLDEASVASIKYLLTLKGLKQKDIAHYFGVDPSHINAIYKGKLWSDIKAIPCDLPNELAPHHDAAMRKEMDGELTKLEYELQFQQWELRAAHVRYEHEVLKTKPKDIQSKYGLNGNQYYDIINRKKFPNIKPLKP